MRAVACPEITDELELAGKAASLDVAHPLLQWRGRLQPWPASLLFAELLGLNPCAHLRRCLQVACHLVQLKREGSWPMRVARPENFLPACLHCVACVLDLRSLFVEQLC
jgi:hypothetical protein